MQQEFEFEAKCKMPDAIEASISLNRFPRFLLLKLNFILHQLTPSVRITTFQSKEKSHPLNSNLLNH